jgi:hypothetical protein
MTLPRTVADVLTDHVVLEVYLAEFEAAGTVEGMLFAGKGQEKTRVFPTEKCRNPVTGVVYRWIVRATAMVNHFYFSCVDAEFGPFFLKSCSYFPYNARLCVNGNERAKRVAAAAGLRSLPDLR